MFRRRVALRLQSYFKYSTSFFKREWDLDDYPIEVLHQAPQPSAVAGKLPGGYHMPEWIVRIPQWVTMFGMGSTEVEAYSELRERFRLYKSKGNKLPRPGTKAPIQIEIAPSANIDQHEVLALDFFDRILDMNYQNVLITDLSSLWDFPSTLTEAEQFERIRNVYDVDISDITDGNLLRIFNRIEGKEQLHKSSPLG
jgi:hypothetical protein